MEKIGIFEAIRQHLARQARPPNLSAYGEGFSHQDGDPKIVALQNVIHDVVGGATAEARASSEPTAEDRRKGLV